MAAEPGGEVVVYEAPDGEARVDVRLDRETVWLSLSQMAELFGRDKSVISRHLRNVFQSGELERVATVAKNATVQSEGGREVEREIEFFNLDAILSVGYRVSSKRGTQFRIWATRTLREHLVRGYTLDRQRFARNAAELEAALSLASPNPSSKTPPSPGSRRSATGAARPGHRRGRARRPERSDPNYRDVVLEAGCAQALARLNPRPAARGARRRLPQAHARADAPSLVERNRAVHRMLVDGVTVEYRRKDGSIAGAQARVIDFDVPDNNDWLAVNQFTVAEGQHTRRPDVVLFVNGLPLAVIELKNAADENATVWSAFQQLQTYQAQIPALFATNAGAGRLRRRAGADRRARRGQGVVQALAHDHGREDARRSMPELQVVLEGVFEKRRFLDLLRYFIVFEDSAAAGAAASWSRRWPATTSSTRSTWRWRRRCAPRSRWRRTGRWRSRRAGTRRARPGGEPGDRRVGVVWHTQGSGKSLTMAFYAGRVILHPAMENPTIVVLTDRNDLDDQLFGTFARCRDLLRQPPVQAADRADLRAKLAVASAAWCSPRSRSSSPRSGRPAPGALGAAQHRRHRRRGAPQPVRLHRRLRAAHARRAAARLVRRLHRHADREDRRQHARRVRRLHQRLRHPARGLRRRDGADLLREPAGEAGAEGSERPKIDPEFEEATEGEEVERKEKLKSQVGAARGGGRLREPHQARRPRPGRALREPPRGDGRQGDGGGDEPPHRVELYRELVALRPEWHGDDDEQGALKVVMTGSASDPLDWQPHIRNKPRREALARASATRPTRSAS
jgi:type I restriction enzyme, R subunit